MNKIKGFIHVWQLLLTSTLVFGLTLSASAQNYKKLTRNARKSYNKGNRVQAIELSTQALALQPSYEKAREVLILSYPGEVQRLTSTIDRLEASSQKFSGEGTVAEKAQIVESYEELIQINQWLSQVPQSANLPQNIVVKDHQQDYQNAQEAWRSANMQTAEMFYQKGKELYSRDRVDSYKAAAKSFQKAQMYVPNYKDSDQRYQEARKLGTKRVAIIPFNNQSGKSYFGAIGDKITDDLIATLLNDQASMEFIEIITRDQLETVLRERNIDLPGTLDERTSLRLGKELGVHEIITGRITQIMTSSSPTTQRAYREKNDVVVDKVAYINEKGKKRTRNVYGEVNVTVIEYSNQASATINGSYQIIDIETGKLKKSDSFSETFEFNQRWGLFKGDERALSKASHQLTSTPEQPIPSEEMRVNKAGEQLSRSLSTRIKSYVQ